MAQESQAGSRQRRGQQCGGQGSLVIHVEGDDGEAHRRDATHPCSQPVKPVNPVDGVGDARQPQHRHQQTEACGELQHLATQMEVNGSDADARFPYRRCHQKLHGEPGQGRQREQIVSQTNAEKRQ